MPSTFHVALLFVTLAVSLPTAYAFGAGDIPEFAYLHEKAFRHGDIENALEEVVKSVAAGGLLAFAKHALAKTGPRFSKEDIKKVYFGNWLRDYSQAVDIAGLSQLSLDTIVLIISVLGFTVFGYATEEFEINAERLGVYLPVEHIDNPKGYGASEPEGDARRYNPKLRPPVDPKELFIDPRNGMKCYIATEDQGWDSSTAHIRRTFLECIKLGRRSEGHRGADLDAAYSMLGKGLHTMEDLLAHSNWLEIALQKIGFTAVFAHVGDSVYVEAPSGESVPPLVTGTFGGADFVHSLLGEATDHLSQASVTALEDSMAQQQNQDVSGKLADIKAILGKLGMGSEMKQAEDMHAQSSAYHFDPNNIAPPEVQKQLLDLLKWRDNVCRIIEKTISLLGLSDLFESWMNAINAYVFTTIAPWLTPILSQATTIIGAGSKTIIDDVDQYEVFDNPHASDPTHSLLSKDHFGLILNEPAGKIARVVIVHATQLIVQAWSSESDPNEAIDVILEAFHHPYFTKRDSTIQKQMTHELAEWVRHLGRDVEVTMAKLTKESVRTNNNRREGSGYEVGGYSGCGHGSGATDIHSTSEHHSTTSVLDVEVAWKQPAHVEPPYQESLPMPEVSPFASEPQLAHPEYGYNPGFGRTQSSPAYPAEQDPGLNMSVFNGYGDWSPELAEKLQSKLHIGTASESTFAPPAVSSISYAPSFAFPEPNLQPPPQMSMMLPPSEPDVPPPLPPKEFEVHGHGHSGLHRDETIMGHSGSRHGHKRPDHIGHHDHHRHVEE